MGDQELKKRRTKGISAERELVVKLWKLGFAVIRGPASGARVKKSIYPDIVAMKNGHIFAIEVKRRSKIGHIYINRERLAKLEEFARRAGGEALIAIKVSELKTWKAVPLTLVKPTSDSMVKIEKETIEKAEDLIRYLTMKISVSLDMYLSVNNGKE